MSYKTDGQKYCGSILPTVSHHFNANDNDILLDLSLLCYTVQLRSFHQPTTLKVYMLPHKFELEHLMLLNL